MTTGDEGASTRPRVAVIVPAYNESEQIGGCVASLMALDYPRDRYEVIVVDNGSADDTVELARAAGARVVSLPEGKVGAVRNHGVAVSESEIVAFLDADCRAPARWLDAAVAELVAEPTTGATGGTYLVPQEAGWLERAWGRRPRAARGKVAYLAAGSLVMWRERFEALDGFDTRLSAGEDEDLCRRILAGGRHIVSLPEAAVYHLGFPATLGDVYRRQRWQGANQLESAKSRFDKSVWMTHLFGLGLLALPPLLLAQLWPAAGAVLLAVLGIPLLAALRRPTVVRNSAERLLRPGQLWLLFLFYFLGRTAGLAINYRNRLTGSDAKVFKHG